MSDPDPTREQHQPADGQLRPLPGDVDPDAYCTNWTPCTNYVVAQRYDAHAHEFLNVCEEHKVKPSATRQHDCKARGCIR